MKKPITSLLHSGIISLVLLLAIPTGAKAECHALFGFNQTPNTLTVVFSDSSSSSFEIISYLWQFGDGSSSDLHNPSHTYAEAGTYNVCLTIHDNHGCQDMYCHNVVVAPVTPPTCHALFTFAQTPNTLTVVFTDASTSPHDIISRLWTFGDGGVSDAHNPSHTYATAGTYEVCLTIHDASGCTDTYCTNVVVAPVNQQNCNALFGYAQAQNSLLIEFIDSSTSTHDITSWHWTFGDGTESNDHTPHHTYSQPGTYNVCLTIHDNHDCSDTYCENIVVAPVNQGDCNALFGYNQAQNSLLIEFFDSSSSSHDIVSWLWTFGDGTSSDTHNPHHTYSAPGTYNVCLTIHDNHDCTDSYCHDVVVAPINQGDCNALFGYNQAQNSLLIEFFDSSTSAHDITTWHWTFGDGTESNDHNPHHTYSAPGTYVVCLTIHDNHDCNDTYCENVVVAAVQGDCMALFDYYQLANSLTIQFVDSSSSSHEITSYLWTFGDGSSGDGHDPHHTYDHPGTYEVCLTIHDNGDCSDTYCHNVTVDSVAGGNCMALFTYNQAQNSLLVEFTDHSTSAHDIVSWLWTFGDGTSSDQHNPHHLYNEPGSYEVCLTIHDNSDCNDTYCQTITVDSVGGGDCMALFGYYQLANSLTIHFIDSSSSSHEITSYLWNFGDGHNGDGHSPNHTYEHPGTYEVCLTIHDNSGCNDTYCQNVTVDSILPGDCHALFVWYQADNTYTVHFIDSSSSSHDITTYYWTFGDGHVGDSHNPNHTYEHAGTYEVCLTIHDNSDCNDTYCQTITVDSVAEGECNALFGYYQAENTQSIHFIDSSSSQHDIVSYLWDFGDGHTGDGHNPVHTYEQPGNYTVCLTIHDNTGCSSTYCHEITVTPPTQGECQAFFGYQEIDSTLMVQFSDSSTSPHDIISWLWHFGDGSSSDQHNPTHTYNHNGTYEVCLIIHDNNGCEDSYCHLITVDNGIPECHAAYTTSVDSSGLIVTFTNMSTNTTPNTTYYWTFGDGTSSTDENPVHTYSHTDNYTVCLYINDPSINCESHVCHIVHAHPAGEGHQGDLPFDEHNERHKKAEKDFHLEHYISIYPNPFTTTTTLQYELDQDARVSIVISDLFGNQTRQIMSENELKGIHKQLIDAGNLNTGIYVVKVMIDQELIIKKITVTR